MKLDYKLKTPQERLELVEKILDETPEPSAQYLESLTDYLIFGMEKEEKRQKKILTENRLATVDKRETSFEGLVSQFENGEDGIYNLISDNKHAFLTPKISITKEDLENIPYLQQLRDSIEYWENKLKTAEGRDAYIIKRTLIDLRKDQYIIKNAYLRPVIPQKLSHGHYTPPLDEKVGVDENGKIFQSGVTLLNPDVCSAILCNYSKIKEDSYDNFNADTWYLIYDFEQVCDAALEPYPIYQRIVELKIDGAQNATIQSILLEEFGKTYSPEYISNLWRRKIPKLIADEAEHQFLSWYYATQERGTYKRCSRCGQVKLAHPKYFSRNKTSKDGLYSICKSCRNKRLGKSN